MTIKEQLYNHCLKFVNVRFQTIQANINEIQESLSSETKSSAGDKHETGRAMLQLEREKAGYQLAEIQKIMETLSKIDNEKSLTSIGLGSIVYTSLANYFISISAGELKVGSESFYAISPSTPIGQLLLGKKARDVFLFKDSRFEITKVE